MKLAVVGSRIFKDYDRLKRELDKFPKINVIVSGGAVGADLLAERYAEENNIETQVYYPYWEKYGKKAGFIRNRQIVDNCDSLIAFWDGESKGTKMSIDLAKAQNKLFLICLF